MADYREISQEYAKEGFKAVALINGGAAVAVLSQAARLAELGLGRAVAWALGGWIVGVIAATVGWLLGFLSTRHVDRSTEDGSDRAREILLSNRYMHWGLVAFAIALAAFAGGSLVLATSLAKDPVGLTDLREGGGTP